MTAGRLRRPGRMLPEEQLPCRRQTSVGAHLDVAEENELDVLRDIFPLPGHHAEAPSYTPHIAACTSSSRLRMRSQEYPSSALCIHSQEDSLLSFQLESCALARNVSTGMLLHHHIVVSGLDNSSSLRDGLAHMYGRCDSCSDAYYCFDNMGDRSASMWTFMISLQFEQKRDERTVVQFFQQSLHCNALPSIPIFLILLSSCKTKEALPRGKQVHVLVKSMACETNVAAGTALLSMYSRCDNFHEAWTLFDKILEKSVVTWNAMIAACVQHGNARLPIQLFLQMQQESAIPNIVTFVSAASSCARELDLSMGKSLHVQALNRGLESNVSLSAAFVSMYGKCGSIENASNVFHQVHVPCVVLWTGMLTVYCQLGCTEEVVYIYKQMQEMGILPNEVTFLCVLSACNTNDLVTTGRRVHAQINSRNIVSNTAMSTALATMYGKFGLTEESNQLFSSLTEKSNIAWNTMIHMFADSGKSGKGIQLFNDMLQQGVGPDKFTFVNVLHVCACSLSAFEGKKVHMHVSWTKFKLDVVICNVLIDMYSKCKLLCLAQMVFDGMHLRNTLSWNTLIAAYAQSGYHEKALILFSQMQLERMCPDAITFASVLPASAQRGQLFDCWRMHTEIICKGFDLDLVVATAVMTSYGRHGHLRSAEHVFHRSHERDDNLWNAFITLLGQHDSSQACQLLYDMKNQGFIPSSMTLAFSLSACPSSYPLARVRQLHVSVLHSGMEVNEIELCILVCAYAECGDLQKACSLFSVPNCSRMLCNCMVGAFAGHGKGRQVLRFFKEMKRWGVSPDEVTLLNLLSGCNHSGLGLVEDAFDAVMSMEYLSRSRSLLAMFHWDCIIDLLGRVGQLNEAMCLTSIMPFQPTLVTWTSLLGACTNMFDIQRGECAANYLFELSQERFVPQFSFYRKLKHSGDMCGRPCFMANIWKG
ncbi:hypothetical protein GOP47_0021114 [Adiantum capillus-veneris]|uniref:Pentatricopeptide repeat-containing protein n=1 Tax=Adiantum capillus-veneris TaxID=13818 RepID=A0A9D4UAG8_ADICA|nr:hypothetical protein GOP47_0021114 [Adiantum capillus-veneris]